MTNLPGGAIHHPWHGDDYWHVGFGWYRPCWVGDSVYYGWAYPPVGYYYPSLPDEYNTTVINNTTYYESDGVYYQEGEQDGKKGYVIAEAPVAPETPDAAAEVEGKNPFEVLKAMCDYLAGLEAFSAVVQATSDEVREDGAKVQISARRVLFVNRPNRLAMDVSGDNGKKRFVYNGKTASLYDAARNMSMIVEAPDTIEAALDALAKEYGVVLPLGDLVYKDLYERAEVRLSAGQYLGLHAVNGVSCHHLGFTSDAADWELWIDAGEKPVPRRITVDYRQDSPRSRYSADIAEWNGAPTFTEQTFEFKPPAGAMGIEISKTNR